jgi:pimeloyl-ACP methyl ester carboxylesterase
MVMTEIDPFRIAVPDAALDDLAARLGRARLPSPPILDGGESAATIHRVENLIGYWKTGYDWRAQERRLNAVPQFRATVDGVGIHFVHVPGAGPDPLPLLLTNGWPSSFIEYIGVLGPLSDPAANGGDPADSFSVVAPALPGYGFSDRCLDRSLDRAQIAGLFHRLMVDGLGYRRYVAHGDDIGGGVVNRLGTRAPSQLVAVQTANPMDPHVGPDDPPLTPAERDYLAAAREWDHTEGAYAHVQATRPQTLAYGLNDSPAGLAAWILEKWLTWTDPATRGRISDDDLLTTVMIYWLTETIGSSSRLYALYSPPRPGDVVTVRTSVLAPHEPKLPVPPESWLRRGYPNLTRLVTLDEGGHFLALESPERFVAEIRDAFRGYR